ncbi:MAG: FAD:protein FMN transferase [Methylovulum sp.]|nr:FAD:protein FMN transferase [Methylovulum sp.]
MGSPCSMQFYSNSSAKAEALYQLVLQRIAQLEQRYSRYRDDSLITEINSRAGTGVKTPIDPETVALLHYADQCYRESQQLFDVTSGVLRRVWDFKNTALPTKAEINAVLPLIGWKKVQWDAQNIYLPQTGMQLDFGGIVKEYAADAVASLFRQQGVLNGIVELGGDIRVIGPMPNNQGWPIAIRDPRHPDKVIAQFKLSSGALASSGDYERFQFLDGVRYSHLLHPKTGWPVTGLQAVSVIAEHCVVAGSMATIAMLKADKGLPWLRKCGVPFLCCQSNGQIFNTL